MNVHEIIDTRRAGGTEPASVLSMSTTTAANSDALQKLRDLTSGIHVAMLTTVDEDGTLHSRPMGTQEVDQDGCLWFFTEAAAEKVGDVQHDQQVNVAY